MTDLLLRERRGAILIARLNRPEVRNALNMALMGEIGQALLDAEQDPAVRVVVLTGAGDRAFCAGMDLAEFADGRPAAGGPGRERFRQFLEGAPGVPVIGAAQATAVAGGMELLLSCDLVVISSDAKLGLPEVKRGLIPGGGGSFLGTRIPLPLAMEIVLTGDSIEAERAYQMGLVNAVVAADQVLDTALALAERIAANGPLAIAAAKELVRLSLEEPTRARERQSELIQSVFASDDAKEGASAFVEKRAPVWKGR